MTRRAGSVLFRSAVLFAALALAACTVTTSGYVRTEVTTAPRSGR